MEYVFIFLKQERGRILFLRQKCKRTSTGGAEVLSVYPEGYQALLERLKALQSDSGRVLHLLLAPPWRT